ncbi:hypothetical protein FOZ62_017212, partial [Perkinsus olseni]
LETDSVLPPRCCISYSSARSLKVGMYASGAYWIAFNELGLIILPQGIPWIAVARRGNCFFQNKTVNAQAAGASGLIVVNAKSSAMVRWMDGMPDAEMPLIPTALVGYEGESLMTVNDAAANDFSVSDPQQIILTKPGPPDDKIRTRIAFVCDETFRSADVKATSTCRPGDGVTLNRPAEAPRPAIVKEVMGGGMLKVDTIEDDGVTQRRGRII